MDDRAWIPGQETGIETNTESEVTFDRASAAQQAFVRTAERLKNVNAWHELAGTGTAEFQLTDARGNPVNRPPEPGDHFRIDIPGPGPATGDGYDWVRIEEVAGAAEGEEEKLMIRVRPATNPTNDNTDIAHFFSEEATSCFMVRREGNRVIAGVYGRNEKPNWSSEKLIDKARNTAVASGAAGGFSKLQWKRLTDGLVAPEK